MAIAFSVLAAGLVGCSSPCKEQPSFEDIDFAGNSVGCGNPPRLAGLSTTDVDVCPNNFCGNGNLGPAKYHVHLGKSLEMRFTFPPDMDAPQIIIYLFAAQQIPVFEMTPLDSFPLADPSTFVLDPKRLENAWRNSKATSPNQDIFAFNLHVKLTQKFGSITYVQEAHLAGMGLAILYGKFTWSDSTLWGNDSTGQTEPPSRSIMGKLVWNAENMVASSGDSTFVFVSGSPFHAPVNPANSEFRLQGLTNSKYELRAITIPSSLPINHKLKVYLLKPGGNSSGIRQYLTSQVVDSVTVP
ncbi:MAG: hypothetical protein ABIQ80_19355 [Fibrobacteria bacterium]